MSRELLKISKDGDSTASLGNLCQGFITLTVEKVFPEVQAERPVLQSVPIASGPGTEMDLAPSPSHPPSGIYMHG